MSTKQKTVFDEAIADVKKLRELAESRARDEVLLRVEPRLKELVEKHLFEESGEDDVDDGETTEESSGVAAVQGAVAVPAEEPIEEGEQYEVSDDSAAALAELADLTRPVTDDRFAVDVYRLEETIQRMVVAPKSEKLQDPFAAQLDEAISKLEDMYAYLREVYSGDDRDAIEVKLEKGYSLVNAVRESTMKMRDLLKEEDLTLKINNLPDGVDPDAVTVDLVADEADPAVAAADPMATADAAAPPLPTAESDDMGDDEDDEVIEISESELKAELSRLQGLKESDAPATVGHGPGKGTVAFGDGDEEGDAFVDPTSELDDLTEAKLASAKSRLARSAKRLTEARGTDREGFARSMYRSAVKAYKAANGTQDSTPAAAKNAADGSKLNEANGKVAKLTKQLAESQLLNAKLIHANKLLRLEGLTKAQQAMVIDRLDEARNLREVRLISENIKAALAGSKGSVNESASRRPSGSASRPGQSGASTSQPLTEGLETARWATLAGLK